MHSLTPIEMVLIVRLSVRVFHLGNRWTGFDKMCYQHCAIWSCPIFVYEFGSIISKVQPTRCNVFTIYLFL